MSDDTPFDELYRKGTAFLHRGTYSRARPLLEKAQKLDPTHLDTAINLSGVYILTKKFKRAAELLESFQEEYPDNEMIWTNLGAAYLGNPILAKSEDQERAIEAFKKAIAINPIAPNVAYNIGLIYRDRKETENAIYWFKKAVQANPRDKDARNILRKLQSSEQE